MDQLRNGHDERTMRLPDRRPDEEFRTLSSAITVDVAARSSKGSRSANADHYLVVRLGRSQETIVSSLPGGEVPDRFNESGYAICVADGTGTLETGEAASRMAISTLAHLALHFAKWNLRIDPRTADDVVQRGIRFFRGVDEHVAQAATDNPELSGMGTTLTLAFIADDTLFLGHVGHARAYLLRESNLTQLSRDQTLAQRFDNGFPAAPTAFAAHDAGHILTDVIGGQDWSPSIQFGRIRLQPEDCVLICTNGLTDVVDDETIASILRQPGSVDERCQALVDLALSRNAADNVTTVVAKYSVPGGPVPGFITHL
jgi:serine/threonine protein phosphatase PrpC